MKKRKYHYNVGEIVNNNVRILEQTTKVDSRGSNIAAYLVECTESKERYIATQFNLKAGYGSAFAAKKSISKLNWLYKEKHLHKYFKNIEDSKKVSVGSDKYIDCICPNCKAEKSINCRNLVHYGFTCPNCSVSISYPERFLMGYLEVKNIPYITQYRLKDQRRFFDFYLPELNMAIECHGEQHYKPTELWKEESFERTLESDKDKEEYCRANNIELVVLDCRKSYFSFIANAINTSVLENILEHEEEHIKKILVEKKFNKLESDIIHDYQEGKLSINAIRKKYNVSHKHVTDIASRAGIRTNRNQHKKVICLNNGVIYDSITEAARSTGCNTESIKKCCNGLQKSTKNKLKWNFYLDDIV